LIKARVAPADGVGCGGGLRWREDEDVDGDVGNEEDKEGGDVDDDGDIDG